MNLFGIMGGGDFYDVIKVQPLTNVGYIMIQYIPIFIDSLLEKKVLLYKYVVDNDVQNII